MRIHTKTQKDQIFKERWVETQQKRSTENQENEVKIHIGRKWDRQTDTRVEEGKEIWGGDTDQKRGTEPQRPKERNLEHRVKEAETCKADRDKRHKRDWENGRGRNEDNNKRELWNISIYINQVFHPYNPETLNSSLSHPQQFLKPSP